jgi:hypothetical protein
MVRTGRLTLLALLMVGLFCATACQKKKQEKHKMATVSDLEEAAEDTEAFFEALEDRNMKKATLYLTLETQPVMEMLVADIRNIKKEPFEKPDIQVDILERHPQFNHVKLKVQIKVGPQVKVEMLTLVPIEGRWRLVMPRKKLPFLRMVVIYQPSEIYFVKEKKHTGRGHAYGHHKSK